MLLFFERQADSGRQTVACGAAAATSEWLLSQTATHDDVRMLRHFVGRRTDGRSGGQNAVQGAVARKWELC